MHTSSITGREYMSTGHGQESRIRAILKNLIEGTLNAKIHPYQDPRYERVREKNGRKGITTMLPPAQQTKFNTA